MIFVLQKSLHILCSADPTEVIAPEMEWNRALYQKLQVSALSRKIANSLNYLSSAISMLI